MKIAAAQTRPHSKDAAMNMQCHLRMADLAAAQGVRLLLFPEMSLTGYELENAAAMAFTENDARLLPLKNKAQQYGMTIVAGAPIKLGDKLHIGAYIFNADGTKDIYTKQYLHAGEELYFSPGTEHNPLLQIGDERVSVAICADITEERHPQAAAARGTTLYIAGIFYRPHTVGQAHGQLSAYAKEYGMKVLMANFVGSSNNTAAGGQSAYWNDKGEMESQLDATEQELLIVEL